MKIGYLHQYFCTPEMPGGTRSYEFARRLAADGHDVHVITSRTDGSPDKGWTIELRDGLTIHWYPNRYENRMGPLRRVASFLRFSAASSARSWRVNADVNIATSTPLTIAIPALVTRITRKTPYLFEVRDLWPEMPIAIGALRSSFAIHLAKSLERMAYRGASHIVALSPGMVDGVVNVDGRPHVVTLVPNSCDRSMRAADGTADEFRRTRDWLGTRPLVVYAGTLGRLNGVAYMVKLAEAARRVDPEVRFLIVGDGAEAESIRRAAAGVGVLGTNLFMEPPVSKSKIPEVLAAADLACVLFKSIPEMEKNSSNKFFDALASGTPVLLNYGGWHRDLVLDQAAGLALGASPTQADGEAIVGFLRDESARRAAEEGALRLAESFDRDRMYAQFSTSVMMAAGDCDRER